MNPNGLRKRFELIEYEDEELKQASDEDYVMVCVAAPINS